MSTQNSGGTFISSRNFSARFLSPRKLDFCPCKNKSATRILSLPPPVCDEWVNSKHPNRATLCLLYTSLCTGEPNAIRKQKCFICSPFHVRARRWAISRQVKPQRPKAPGGGKNVCDHAGLVINTFTSLFPVIRSNQIFLPLWPTPVIIEALSRSSLPPLNQKCSYFQFSHKF